MSRSRPAWQPCSPTAHVHAPPGSCFCLPVGPRTIHAPAQLTLCMLTTAHCEHVSCSLRSRVVEDDLGYHRTGHEALGPLPTPRKSRCQTTGRDAAAGAVDGSTASTFTGAERRVRKLQRAGSIGTVPMGDSETQSGVGSDVCVFRFGHTRMRAREAVYRAAAHVQQVRSASQHRNLSTVS